MPSIMKPNRLGAAVQHEVTQKGGRVTISAYALFDFASPNEFMTDQALWAMVAEQMPAGSVFDKGQLKPMGEFLVVGNALSPTETPVRGTHVVARVGDRQKQLAVFGNRVWRLTERGIVMTDAQPFDHMPIDMAHAYGGPNLTGNRQGKGHGAKQMLEAGFDAPLPNVEYASRLIKSPDDTVYPAHLGPIALDDPHRMAYAGTYDQNWVKNISPAKPADFNPLFNMEAPEDQRWDGYFHGGEIYSVSGMSRSGSAVGGQLPSITVRCFIHRKSDDSFTETRMVCDTLALFPNVTKAIMVFRAVAEASDSLCDDIDRVLIGMESQQDTPKDPAHYLKVYQLRCDPEEAQKYFMADYQLMPQHHNEAVSEKRKEQLERAQSDRETYIDNLQWFSEKLLKDQGVEPDLAPKSGMDAFEDLPLVAIPSSEEIASGEFDLAQLIDDVQALEEATNKKRDQELAKLELQRRAIVEATPRPLLPKHVFEPVASDDIVAQFTGEAVPEDLKSDLDRLNGVLNDTDSILEGLIDEEDPDLSKTIREKILSFNDELFNEAPDPEEVDKQVRLAIARALGEPEGEILHEVKKSIGDLSFEFPSATEAEGSTALEDEIMSAFAALGDMTFGEMQSNEQEVKSDPKDMFPASFDVDVSAASEKLEALNQKLAEDFPQFVKDGQEDDILGSIIASAQSIKDPSPKPDPSMTVSDYIDEQKSKTLDMVTKGEERLNEGIEASRLLSPAAIFPMEAFLDGVASAFGERIKALLAEGYDFKGADLAGADLRGVDFSNRDLSGTCFEKADLTGANFSGSKLVKAVFTEANLTRAKLSGTDLSLANLNHTILKEAVLDHARLKDGLVLNSDLSGASLQGCAIDGLRLIDCVLNGADFTGARLYECQIVKGSAAGLVMAKASLEKTMLLCLALTKSNFKGAQLNNVAFAEADARGSDFSHAHIQKVGFMGKIDLSGSTFAECDAKELGCNMTILAESCFLRSKVEGCMFQDCDMHASDLRLASFKNSRLSKSNLMDCDMFGTNFYGATLGFADMRRASLRNANLYFADLMDTKLGSADLSGANLGGTLLEQPSDG
ncbi:DUF2169 domain-containing protein [uncultured Cohaesibacter sp.]|uniref:DUF2169 family type VI secretion system accessory protein n=1 Tax=uncultured Cohaesibacter sp. TaxID=1002546 RepID=UPI0029C78189|nr:DUF2169 domain-containing protein [uncultured Cohaesibacter sp.]